MSDSFRLPQGGGSYLSHRKTLRLDDEACAVISYASVVLQHRSIADTIRLSSLAAIDAEMSRRDKRWAAVKEQLAKLSRGKTAEEIENDVRVAIANGTLPS